MILSTTALWRRRATIAGLAVIGVAAAALPGSAALKQDQAAHGGATRLSGDNTQTVRNAVKGGHAKNVILLIGDGMGSSEITIARNANACGQIGETLDLDEAVQAAMAFAKKDGNTCVFVTADHSHTSQIVAAGSVSDYRVVLVGKDSGKKVSAAFTVKK